MAKELPYFKFEPNAWDSGMIQLCSLEAKGLFIEICCLYWSRLGDLPYALALQKLCNGDSSLLQELEKNQIYEIHEEEIRIHFLDIQLDEFQKTSEKRKKAADKRWKSTSAMQVHSNSNAIREDKSRGEEIREENNTLPCLDEFIKYGKEKAIKLDFELDVDKATAKYLKWEANDWHTLGDKPRKIKNWKSTLINSLKYMKKEESQRPKLAF